MEVDDGEKEHTEALAEAMKCLEAIIDNNRIRIKACEAEVERYHKHSMTCEKMIYDN
jgi:hypothetical protein